MQVDKVSIKIMKNTAKITIEELAVNLNGKMWTKGDLKRIYLDRGYNTKKMSTKTYVEETSEENFNVKCFVECDSQDYNWCESQANQVIESVDREIAEALATEYFYVVNEQTNEVIDDCQTAKPLADLYVGGGLYLSEGFAKNFIKREDIDGFKVMSISRSEYEALEKTPKILPVIERKTIQRLIAKPLTEVEQNLTFAPGTIVIHNRFGKGEIIAIENEEPAFRKLTILFEDGTEKTLLERFANLTKVDFIEDLIETLKGKTEMEKKNLCFAALKKLETGEIKDKVHEMCDYYLDTLREFSEND